MTPALTANMRPQLLLHLQSVLFSEKHLDETESVEPKSVEPQSVLPIPIKLPPIPLPKRGTSAWDSRIRSRCMGESNTSYANNSFFIIITKCDIFFISWFNV